MRFLVSENFEQSKVTFLVVKHTNVLDAALDYINKSAPKHLSFIALSSREDFLPVENKRHSFKSLPPVVEHPDISYFVCPGGSFKFQTLTDDMRVYTGKGISKKLFIHEDTAIITSTDLTCEQGVADFYGVFKITTSDTLQKKMKDVTVFKGAKIALARQYIEQTRCPRLKKHENFLGRLMDVRALIRKELENKKSGLIIVSTHAAVPFENSVGLALHNCALDFSDVFDVFYASDDGFSKTID